MAILRSVAVSTARASVGREVDVARGSPCRSPAGSGGTVLKSPRRPGSYSIDLGREVYVYRVCLIWSVFILSS